MKIITFMDINKTLQLASQYYQQGDLQQAESIYKKILKSYPYNFHVLNFLGNVLQEQRRVDEAVECYQKAIKLNRTFAGSYFHLGSVFEKSGEFKKAIHYYQEAIKYNPMFDGSYNNLGNVFRKIGQEDEAIPYFEKAIEINPNFWGAYYNLGEVLQNKGQPNKAIPLFQKTLQMNPQHIASLNNLGNCLKDKGAIDEAIVCYQKAIQQQPDHAISYYNLGVALEKISDYLGALSCLRTAIQLNPDYVEARLNLGNVLYELGRQEESIIELDRAVAREPHNFRARLAQCICQLPIIYSGTMSIQTYRNRYYEHLVRLTDMMSSKSLQDLKTATEAVGSMQPFYLTYQGMNDRELQRLYGSLITRIMSARYPHFAEHPSMPPHSFGEPIRVGIVSGYFHLHSNWKIPIKGWVENIDKRKFSLYGYYTGEKNDIATDDAKKSFTRFIKGLSSFDELCKTIKEDNLHVLIYPEIGMDPTTVKLASLRLAPIQCSSWGHPDTSGLPTIDYFMSSDLMEPPDADEHYTEKLVRLPNLSIYYTPFRFRPATISRATFGFDEKTVIYLCCQSLFKYLPQYDEIYPRIAKETGHCRFLFLSHKRDLITDQFRLRIHNAFRKLGMKADDYIFFLPRLDESEYNAVNCMSDVYLDSIGWSGCNSTFEALYHNLPIVTLPGKMMRGRHSSAILSMMGITETIASRLDEYIEIAVRLGTDLEWRKQTSDKIAANKNLVYQDKTCITALEDFLERVVQEKFSKDNS
jgi:protein O-GlcNAc transferase